MKTKQKKLEFNYFKKTVANLLEFRGDCEFNEDYWYTLYKEHKDWLLLWSDEYKKSQTMRKLIIEWCNFWFENRKKETHNHWLKPKNKSKSIAYSPDCG